MTVGELLDRMSSRELTEWMAFSELEPFGAGWENLLAALGPYTNSAIHTAPEDREELALSRFMVLDDSDQSKEIDEEEDDRQPHYPSVIGKLKNR